MSGAEKIADAMEAIKNLKDYVELERVMPKLQVVATQSTVKKAKNESLTMTEDLIKQIKD